MCNMTATYPTSIDWNLHALANQVTALAVGQHEQLQQPVVTNGRLPRRCMGMIRWSSPCITLRMTSLREAHT